MADTSRTGRASLKTLVAFVDPELSDDLKRDAIDHKATMQIMVEGAAMYFHKALKRKDSEAIAILRELVGQRTSTGPKRPAQQQEAKLA